MTDGNKVTLYKTVKTKKNETKILEAFDRNGLTYKEDSAFDHTWAYGTPYLQTKNDSGKVIYQPIDRFRIYNKVEGAVYTIDKLIVGKDTIYDLEIAIDNRYHGRNVINLRNFRHTSIPDSSYYSYTGYYLYKHLKKPIKRKFKEIVK